MLVFVCLSYFLLGSYRFDNQNNGNGTMFPLQLSGAKVSHSGGCWFLDDAQYLVSDCRVVANS